MSFLLTAGTTDDDAFSGVTLVYRTKEREKRFFFLFPLKGGGLKREDKKEEVNERRDEFPRRKREGRKRRKKGDRKERIHKAMRDER